MRYAFPSAILALFLSAAPLAADVDLELAAVERTRVERVTRSPQEFTVAVAAEDIRPFSRNMAVDDILDWVSIEGPAVNPKLLVEGMPEEIRANQTVHELYLGSGEAGHA